MPTWNLQKRNMLSQLQEDQAEFYKTTFPKIVQQLQLMLGSAVDSQMVGDMIFNATEIRALLKDWDRTTFNT